MHTVVNGGPVSGTIHRCLSFRPMTEPAGATQTPLRLCAFMMFHAWLADGSCQGMCSRVVGKSLDSVILSTAFEGVLRTQFDCRICGFNIRFVPVSLLGAFGKGAVVRVERAHNASVGGACNGIFWLRISDPSAGTGGALFVLGAMFATDLFKEISPTMHSGGRAWQHTGWYTRASQHRSTERLLRQCPEMPMGQHRQPAGC